MKEIKPQSIDDGEVVVPGSKSLTHRLLIAAALSDGPCTIENPLLSDDIRLTMSALTQMGITIEEIGGILRVQGRSGQFVPCADPIFLGNSGTTMRLLTAVSALGSGPYLLSGSERMQERPIQDLLDALGQAGVSAQSIHQNGCPPVEVTGGDALGGDVAVDCTVSSQFLSALLLMAPYTRIGLGITVKSGLVSRPYVDLTVDVMDKFGVAVKRDEYRRFFVHGGQAYRAGRHTVEPDCSQAGYFWAAAAVTGRRIKVKGVAVDSKQGDVQFVRVLEEMGCRIDIENDGIAVLGDNLNAVIVDMSSMPDLVPTLAVVAAFADGVTVIENVAHLRNKESDRLAAVATELLKMGIDAEVSDDGLTVRGGHPNGAVIETYEDHRIAMSFAVAGLKVPGVIIENEACVAKSFPNFWEVFEGLRHHQ